MKYILILIFLSKFLFGDITQYFPPLDGRVIDQAHLLSSQTQEKLTNVLKSHEDSTSNQIVVVILNTLNGYEISDYSYQLGRYWGIGQKDKDNGVLLVISMDERKIRVEVGYGLEGALTDKISHEIIEYTIKPNFRQKNFEKGISKAVEEIIQAIKGEYKNKTIYDNSSSESFNPFIFFIIIFASIFMTGISSKSKNLLMYKISKSSMLSSFFGIFTYVIASDMTKYGLIFAIFIFIGIFIFNFINTKKIDKPTRRLNTHTGSSTGFDNDFNGFSRGGSFGGGFSGGGGSFGGGGASGGW